MQQNTFQNDFKIITKWIQNGARRMPKDHQNEQREPKDQPEEPKALQKEAERAHGRPTDGPDEPKAAKRTTPARQRDDKGSKRTPKDTQRPPTNYKNKEKTRKKEAGEHLVFLKSKIAVLPAWEHDFDRQMNSHAGKTSFLKTEKTVVF